MGSRIFVNRQVVLVFMKLPKRIWTILDLNMSRGSILHSHSKLMLEIPRCSKMNVGLTWGGLNSIWWNIRQNWFLIIFQTSHTVLLLLKPAKTRVEFMSPRIIVNYHVVLVFVKLPKLTLWTILVLNLSRGSILQMLSELVDTGSVR